MTLKGVVASKPSVVTPWTRVWICARSVLTQSLFKILIDKGHDFVQKVLVSTYKRLASVAKCFRLRIHRFGADWRTTLATHPLCGAPLFYKAEMRRSLMSCTAVADRILNLLEADGNTVVNFLENRWRLTEHPPMLMVFNYSPAYRKFAIQKEMSEKILRRSSCDMRRGGLVRKG